MSHPILATLLFFLGAMFLKFAFYIADGPNPSIWLLFIDGAVWLCAILLIFQAVFLALAGMWLPDILRELLQ